MIKRLFLGAIALLVFFPALARAQSTFTIGVVGSSSVANTVPYGCGFRRCRSVIPKSCRSLFRHDVARLRAFLLTG
jgi:hypothetical protein